MEVQEKHRLEILNAKCEYACAVDTLVKKMKYGEDVDCCVNKLYLASRIINRLECYCFDSIPLGKEEVKSQFFLQIKNASYPSGTTGQVIINGSQVYNLTATTTVYERGAVKALLSGSNISYLEEIVGMSYTYLLTCDPSVTSFRIIFHTPIGETTIYDFTFLVHGVPNVSECHNCIEDSNLREMYALLNQLLA